VKNKKLFAILTLVCFMFTLMPVAAFAADTFDADQVYVVQTGTPSSAEDNTALEINETQGFKAFVGKGEGAFQNAGDYVFYVVDEAGNYIDVNNSGNFSSTILGVDGDYTVYAIKVSGLTGDVSTVLNKVTSVENKVTDIKAWAGARNVVNGTATVTVKSQDATYRITLELHKDTTNASFGPGLAANTYEMDIEASNGFVVDGKLVAQLEKSTDGGSSWADVTRPGIELKIENIGYVNVAADTLKTNNKGQVVFNITADYANAGNKVILKYGKAKTELVVDAGGTAVTNVKVNNEPATIVNIADVVEKANVEFKFTDANGVAAAPNASAGVVDTTTAAKDVAITVVEKPAKSTLKATDLQLIKQDGSLEGTKADVAGVYTLKCTKSGNVFDKEGTYVIKVALKNGASATATIKVAEMGDPVKIMFVKAPTTVALNGSSPVASVFAVDANGVMGTTPITTGSGLVLSANGAALDTTVDPMNGTVAVKADEKYIGTKVTVLAVWNKMIANYDLTVVEKAADVVYTSTDVEVGISTNLIGQVKDAEGNKVAITGAVVDARVLEKPENAVIDVKANMNEGNVVLTVLASAAGEYKVQTILTFDGGYILSTETITVGGGVNAFNDVVVISMGADSMIVNNELVKLDVAPFIENNRTMLQYNVLYVFGIDVDWVPETNSVVAEGNGTKVVMTLGSKVATVNGQEVTLDVAPYSLNGRTIVPVGLITGVFDINFDFTRNADGTIADIIFTK